MIDKKYLKKRIEELVGKNWDLAAIEARFQRFIDRDPNNNFIQKDQCVSCKDEILDRVQQYAEEYCYLTRSCAKGSATALFDVFGLGNSEMIRALTPFPGLGMSGNLCGPVTGGLIAIGLYFSDENPTNHDPVRAFIATRKFIDRFEKAFGSLLCPDVQKFILGKYVDPLSGPENFKAFEKLGPRERCPLAPGIGARIVAELIIEDMEDSLQ